MTTRTSTEAFAEAVAAMVHDDHVGDILARLLTDCCEVLGVDAAAILVLDDRHRPTLLSSTSHGVEQLEMLQAQEEEGPCVDVMASAVSLRVAGADTIRKRWPEVGQTIVEAGFGFVAAHPMAWHGRVLGGLNLFAAEPPPDDSGSGPVEALGRAFADLATVVLVHTAVLPPDQITTRVHAAVVAREVVEQAKGVLAQLRAVGIPEAGRLLQEMARLSGRSLSVTAAELIEQVQQPSHRP
jgi:hypothetical protein